MIKTYLNLLVITLIVTITIVYGFVDGGSPTDVKNKRNDETRLNHLSSISNQIYSYYQKQQQLPQDLSTLYQNGIKPLSDPSSGEPYEYRIISGSAYELCAIFATKEINRLNEQFSHPQGRHCYKYTTSSK